VERQVVVDQGGDAVCQGCLEETDGVIYTPGMAMRLGIPGHHSAACGIHHLDISGYPGLALAHIGDPHTFG
jgi:hypothetical protein